MKMVRTTYGLLLSYMVFSAWCIQISSAIVSRQQLYRLMDQGIADELAGMKMRDIAQLIGEDLPQMNSSSSSVDTGRDLLFLGDLWDTLVDKAQGLLASAVTELGSLFDSPADDAVLTSIEEIFAVQQPFEGRNFSEGLVVGLISIFMPALEDSESGMQAITEIQTCFNPASIRAQFTAQEAMTLAQDSALDSLSAQERNDLNTLADDGDKTIFNLKGKLDASVGAVTAVHKFTRTLRKLAPMLLTLLKHSVDCGYGEVLIGFLVSFLVSLFPPLLIILLPLGVALLGVTIYVEIKGLIEEYGKNWFRFGKHLGKVSGLFAALIISYKKSRNRGIECEGEGKCGLKQLKDGTSSDDLNDKKYWSRSKSAPPNKVYQRDDLIDPKRLDSRGRTNLARMQAGLAPIGPDGKSVNLHHVSQSQTGPIAELTQTYHSRNHGALHNLCKTCHSQIDRKAFSAWRSRYWRTRAADMATKVGTDGAATWQLSPAIGAVLSNPSTLTEAASVLPDQLKTIIDEATADMSALNPLRLLLRALKPVAEFSAGRSLAAERDAQGALERCGFDSGCATPLVVSRPLATSASVGAGVRKIFHVADVAVSYVRVSADGNVTVSVGSIVKELQYGDQFAVQLQCSSPLPVSIEVFGRETTSFSLLMGDNLPCHTATRSVAPVDIVPREPGEDFSDPSADSGGVAAGIVVTLLAVAALLALLLLLKRRIDYQAAAANVNSFADPDKYLPLND